MQREGFEGRTVVSVIEDFRSQGWSFAYSTNLVSDDLLVIAEPEDSEPLEIVRQILVPHGLTLRSEEGLWLIVRDDASAARLGSLLIIVRDRRDYMPLDDLKIDATPDLEPWHFADARHTTNPGGDSRYLPGNCRCRGLPDGRV